MSLLMISIRPTGATRPSRWLNSPVTVITVVACIIFRALQLYHQFTIGLHDPSRCQALLHEGAWSPLASDNFTKWEPKNCRMLEYPRSALRECLDDRTVVFAGDSTARQLFWAAAKRLKPSEVEVESRISNDSSNDIHKDYSFRTEGIKLDFIWDPWLNSSALVKILNTSNALSVYPDIPRKINLGEDKPPALIILGAPGLWAARYGGDDYLDKFKNGVGNVLPYISTKFHRSLPRVSNSEIQLGSIRDQILLAPVQVPLYDKLSPDRSETITRARIGAMNEYLLQLSPNESSHVVWAYNEITFGSPYAFEEDGLHVSDSVAARKVDIAFNAHCNAIAKAHDPAFFKGTCCVPEIGNKILIGMLLVFGAINVAPLWPRFNRITRRYNFFSSITVELFKATRMILFTAIVCFYFDRTSHVAKLERHYVQEDFITTCLVWILVSLFSLQEARVASHVQFQSPPAYRGPGYLSREQTDEIKGLLQGFILLYHYHYASQTLWVYKIIRLFISAYFFLSGYGNTLYLLKTNNFSSRRVLSVLIRLNLLSASLPYMMETDYTTYYFAPVITFWYLVVYGMLAFRSHRNTDLRWLFGKVAVTAMLTDLLTWTPGILEALAEFTRSTFSFDWDVREMRFRLRLDRYIVFVGVVVAALVHGATVHSTRTILPLRHARAASPLRSKLALSLLCIAGIALFLYGTQTLFRQKQLYNQAHPFVSWIPILCSVVLRTSYRKARNAHLALPAALGRISLETYVLQYHMWLAHNATARLRLGLWEGG
ncbi:Cas1p-domain-containing protein [Jackrogersella minutella]|nr:Cas1p-domain-containing protein [Jackrogersella minutella]